MKGVSRRQQEILDFIHTFISKNGYSPSYREIMHHFGFTSLGTVYKHVHILQRKGLLTAEQNKRRSLLPTKENLPKSIKPFEMELPFIGHIKGGEQISTFPEAKVFNVPASMVHDPESTYVFRVVGDHLIDEHIVDGDLLIVEARQDVQPGETVIGFIHHEELIVRKFYPEGQYIRLLSHSALQTPLIIKHNDFQIQGVLTGLIRVYG